MSEAVDKRADHLKWPSPDRLGQRLSDAKAQALIVAEAPVKKKHQVKGWNSQRFFVTPQMNPDPYSVRVYYQDPRKGVIYAHCTCDAGHYGVACKHLAAALDTLWDVMSLKNRVRVLHVGEHDEFLNEGTEPNG